MPASHVACSRLRVQLLSERLTWVRYQACRLQLISDADYSQYGVLWLARRHTRGETGSAQAPLLNHGKALDRTSVDRVTRDVECICSRQSF